MRNILDAIIAYGAVPILATKADNVEGRQQSEPDHRKAGLRV